MNAYEIHSLLSVLQISSLVTLQLLSQVGHDDQLDSPKYKCSVSLDFILAISRCVCVCVRLLDLLALGLVIQSQVVRQERSLFTPVSNLHLLWHLVIWFRVEDVSFCVYVTIYFNALLHTQELGFNHLWSYYLKQS